MLIPRRQIDDSLFMKDITQFMRIPKAGIYTTINIYIAFYSYIEYSAVAHDHTVCMCEIFSVRESVSLPNHLFDFCSHFIAWFGAWVCSFVVFIH